MFMALIFDPKKVPLALHALPLCDRKNLKQIKAQGRAAQMSREHRSIDQIFMKKGLFEKVMAAELTAVCLCGCICRASDWHACVYVRRAWELTV